MEVTRRERLEAWLSAKLLDRQDIRVSPLREVSSGSSNDTLSFELTSTVQSQVRHERLILRCRPTTAGLFPDYDLEFQFRVMKALEDSPIRVPRLLFYEPDDAALGSPFIVMEYVDGAVPSDFPPGMHGHGLFFDASEAERKILWWGALEQIATLHTLDWRTLDLPPMIGMTGDPMAGHIERVQRWLDSTKLGPLPAVDAALTWLRRNPLPPAPSSLLWGDARPGNIIYRDNRVAAVVDWELATVGPPELDLAYFIAVADVVAEQHSAPRLSGIPGRDETIAKYERLRGVTLENFMYAEIFVLAELAVIIALAVKAAPPTSHFPADFLTNNSPSIKLNALLKQLEPI